MLAHAQFIVGARSVLFMKLPVYHFTSVLDALGYQAVVIIYHPFLPS